MRCLHVGVPCTPSTPIRYWEHLSLLRNVQIKCCSFSSEFMNASKFLRLSPSPFSISTFSVFGLSPQIVSGFEVQSPSTSPWSLQFNISPGAVSFCVMLKTTNSDKSLSPSSDRDNKESGGSDMICVNYNIVNYPPETKRSK